MKPKYLSKQPHIYLTAPSFGCTTSPYEERLTESLKTFDKLNFRVTVGDNCFKAAGIAGSNTPKLRAKEFMEAYESDAEAILSVGGGETMIEILEHIVFKKIMSLPPKWFVGYSDNTNLTYTLTTICNLETIYSIHASSFYSYPLEYDALDTIRMLKGEKVFKGYPKWVLNETKDIFPSYQFDMDKIISPLNYTNPFKGRLLGGCLDCLSTLCGSKFDYTKEYIKKHNEEGIIFYLEAADLSAIGIRRCLTQLKLAGWFDNVNGFVIGRTRLYNDNSFGETPNHAYIDILGDFNVPILLDCDLGHLSPALPIRNGASATISFIDGNIIIEYKD